MSTAEISTPRAEPQPLPDNFVSIQPGGGRCYRIELAWGRWRRWWLTHFRPGYVRRMAALRKGSTAGAPHEILDPRDLKFCRNRCSCYWEPADDPFRWRGGLPFARWGLAELQLMGWPLLAVDGPVGLHALLVRRHRAGRAVVFDRLFLPRSVATDSRRPRPAGRAGRRQSGRNHASSPHDEFIGGPAVRIGIFLSIFNVHLNRAPAASRVIALRYSPGAFLDARESRMRDPKREHVDRPGGGIAAASADGRPADFRDHRPANRLRPSARARCSAADRRSA